MTSSKTDERIILGVDPGTRITGYAIIAMRDGCATPLDFGCICPPSNRILSVRYHIIFKSLLHLIQNFSPTEMAIETPFVHKNPQSAIKLGSALGCAIIAAKEHDLDVFHYSPREVKQGITGLGGASKEDVEAILRSQLSLHSAPLRPDASDALAIAIHHSNNTNAKAKEL